VPVGDVGPAIRAARELHPQDQTVVGRDLHRPEVEVGLIEGIAFGAGRLVVGERPLRGLLVRGGQVGVAAGGGRPQLAVLLGQDDRRGVEDPAERLGGGLDQDRVRLGLDDSMRQGVQGFGLFRGATGGQRASAGLGADRAGDGGDHEQQGERPDIRRAGDHERQPRLDEEEVEHGDADERGGEGRPPAEAERGDDHRQHEDQREVGCLDDVIDDESREGRGGDQEQAQAIAERRRDSRGAFDARAVALQIGR
jgi:hypothetical protein